MGRLVAALINTTSTKDMWFETSSARLAPRNVFFAGP
jgi:hypothetical protein